MRLRRSKEKADPAARYRHLNPVKLKVIDLCFEQLGCRSFMDLGGIWAVDGGYSRYAADLHEVERGLTVDDDFTDAFLAAEAELPNLDHLRGNFGNRELIAGLPQVDAALFFDVLLHQVDPDWDELLGLYADKCSTMAIVEPQWNGDETIRLLDLGEEEYLATVPADEGYVGLFDRLDDINPRRGRPWRDVHDIWQWGITDDALVARMAELGFEVRHQEVTGPWMGREHFHETAFVFQRPGVSA